MIFPYKRYGQDVVRPVIPIEIREGSSVVRYEVLVDSGADINLVPGEIGELLGIDIESGIPFEVGGVTGDRRRYYMHPVVIQVGGWSYHVEMGFMPGVPMAYGVVGQQGFFDQFQSVLFDMNGEQIEIRR